MPRNVYADINLHFVWRTKDSMPLLREWVRARTDQFIAHYCCDTPGVSFHEVGGTADHRHLVVSIPPTLLISEWIGKVKGACSHHVNHLRPGRKVLDWQTGYGVVSFGAKDLPWVIEYVRGQEEHHAKGTAQDRLERVEAEAEDREGR